MQEAASYLSSLPRDTGTADERFKETPRAFPIKSNMIEQLLIQYQDQCLVWRIKTWKGYLHRSCTYNNQEVVLPARRDEARAKNTPKDLERNVYDKYLKKAKKTPIIHD